jgi:tetratricopeptide (TPR) repeat protein
LLERDAHWGPAADVYATAIELIQPRSRDHDLLPMCYDRQGYCLRQIGQYVGVAELYNEGIAVARDLEQAAADDDSRKSALGWSLRLRISHAVFRQESGDLPEAEYELDKIIEDAEKAEIPDVIARALHERGLVAYERNQDEQAALYLYRAAQMHVDQRLAYRASIDLAVTLADLGHIDYARTICQIVRSKPEAVGQDWKALAGINLMRLAHMRPVPDQREFERLRDELGKENMPGRLRAYYHLTAGQGLQRFGQMQAGRIAFHQAIEVAQAFHVNKLVIRAEQLLKATENEPQKARRFPQESNVLAPILAAIDARRGPFAGASS